MAIKFYVDQSLLIKDRVVTPIPIVEAQLLDLDESIKCVRYGKAYSAFRLTESLDAAEFEVFPYDLRTCHEEGLLGKLFDRQADTLRRGKRLVLFAYNDECLARHFHRSNLVTFANLGYRSTRGENEFCYPWFIDDPLPTHRDGDLPIKQKGEKALVGFCGRGAVTPSRYGWQLLRNTIRTLKSWTRLEPYAPPRIASEVAFRSSILQKLSKSALIESRFLLRSKFLAGISRTPIVRDDLYHPVRLDFFNNIFDTDYTVCVRGASNWSMRLYETMSCGRIPVFIDTDSILPFDFNQEWKDYVVWIKESEIRYADQIIADFHSSISSSDFVDLQKTIRKFWIERLSRDGFYAHFAEHFPAPNPASNFASQSLSREQVTDSSCALMAKGNLKPTFPQK